MKATVLIGLSGAGKSTYASGIFRNAEIISRDAIREELGYCGKGEKAICSPEQENAVSRIFDERMLVAAKFRKHIVIDNLNLKRKYRDAYKKLLSNYNVSWNFIYIEAPGLEENAKRREGVMGYLEYGRMISGFDWPDPEEYDSFIKMSGKS